MKHLWHLCNLPGFEEGWHSHLCECNKDRLEINKRKEIDIFIKHGACKLISESRMFEYSLRGYRVNLKDGSWWGKFWIKHNDFYKKNKKCLCHPDNIRRLV